MLPPCVVCHVLFISPFADSGLLWQWLRWQWCWTSREWFPCENSLRGEDSNLVVSSRLGTVLK